ncbi:MAG: exosortase system-associated protein, TIGR04073 family [Verrucomicrobiales bacterium]|nr:exosortase system-associated protein, TIGR04073 family [Verrucomicrobiales bacterium]
MRSLNLYVVLAVAGLTPLLTGCNSMEKKLGRGLTNLGEPLRLGELMRSTEQNALSMDSGGSPGYGVVHGFARTIERTVVGAFEVATFPIPTQPIIHPVDPVYPDSQQRDQIGYAGIGSDQFIGFQDSSVAPFIPGSEFNPLQN